MIFRSDLHLTGAFERMRERTGAKQYAAPAGRFGRRWRVTPRAEGNIAYDMPRMLIVEDDPDLGAGLETFFRSKGFTVMRAVEGRQALRCLLEPPAYDVVLMDVMLPHKDGFEVLREARRAGVETPVLMLTVLETEQDRLKGFAFGADDYVTKPFSIDELAARVRVALRRGTTQTSVEEQAYRFGDVEVNFLNHTARRGEVSVRLTALEFDVLQYLIQHRGRTVSRKQLLRDVWGIPGEVATRTVDRHVASLRKKIELDAAEPRHILTVYGIGYKFEG
jgi:DNA-binding response OmpR family regulator